MSSNEWKETMVDQRVTYTVESDGKIIIVENVPARVCVETGERLFSPETVERLQQMIWEKREPISDIDTEISSIYDSQILEKEYLKFKGIYFTRQAILYDNNL